jgi:hypothetical protein
VLENILNLTMEGIKGKAEAYELCLPTEEGIMLPCGTSGMFIGEN